MFSELAKFGIGTGILGLIAKNLFSQFLSRDLEGYKAKLQAEHSREIERLKADIRTTAFEHETRFARLHDKRVQVIAELYKLLAQTATAFETWIAPLSLAPKPLAEMAKDAANAANAFFEFFDQNQIYLDEKLCSLILQMREVFNRAWANFGAGFEKPRPKEWMETWEAFQRDIPPLRIEIERRVRALLGVKAEA